MVIGMDAGRGDQCPSAASCARTACFLRTGSAWRTWSMPLRSTTQASTSPIQAPHMVIRKVCFTRIMHVQKQGT